MNNDELDAAIPKDAHEHHPEHHHFEIQIDGKEYKVASRHMTGLELRHLPTPPIGPDRDLLEGEPGGSHRKIGDAEVVEIRNGLRFFTTPIEFEIKIDRAIYKVTSRQMTGVQLRHLPKVPIGPDRDLFEVVPGGTDRKIGDAEVVEIRNGLRFFTAPAQINPGVDGPQWEHRRVAVQ